MEVRVLFLIFGFQAREFRGVFSLGFEFSEKGVFVMCEIIKGN